MNYYPYNDDPFEGDVKSRNAAILLNDDAVFWIFIKPLASKEFDLIEIQSPNNHFHLRYSSISNISKTSVNCLVKHDSNIVRAIRFRVEGITESTEISFCIHVQGFKKGDTFKFFSVVGEHRMAKIEIKQYGGPDSNPLIPIYNQADAIAPHLVTFE
ncbi:hypothetical protein OAP63_05785 [Vibrio sp.]|nr:hypothetical protein [Vibrio sp.]